MTASCGRNREHVRRALAYLEEHGLRGFVSVTGRDHIRISWDKDGRTFHVVGSMSPKNYGNAGREICRDIRRKMQGAAFGANHGENACA